MFPLATVWFKLELILLKCEFYSAFELPELRGQKHYIKISIFSINGENKHSNISKVPIPIVSIFFI